MPPPPAEDAQYRRTHRLFLPAQLAMAMQNMHDPAAFTIDEAALARAKLAFAARPDIYAARNFDERTQLLRGGWLKEPPPSVWRSNPTFFSDVDTGWVFLHRLSCMLAAVALIFLRWGGVVKELQCSIDALVVNVLQ